MIDSREIRERHELLEEMLEKNTFNQEQLEAMTLEEVEKRVTQLQEIQAKRKQLSLEVRERQDYLDQISNGTLPGLKLLYQHENSLNRSDNPFLGMEGNILNKIGRNDKMDNIQIRSLQKYLTAGYKQLDEQEQRALALSGASAVIPSEIVNKLITDAKYSTLLQRATVFNDGKPGKLSIPIASNNAAVWKDENSNVDSSDASYEKSATLTNIVLGGHELYRWMRMSAAAYSMSSTEFEGMMLNLLSSELVEELEKAFVDGTGVGQPTGLKALSFTKDVNAIEVANGTAIAPKDIADAIALLQAKYARNSIVMCNTGTLADIALFKGTSEFAYNLSDGASKFLGHEIVVNEHVADDVIYVVDPKELYVRFAMPVQVEANHSSGFTQASVDLRALTVVDAAWNTKAVSKVYVKAIA